MGLAWQATMGNVIKAYLAKTEKGVNGQPSQPPSQRLSTILAGAFRSLIFLTVFFLTGMIILPFAQADTDIGYKVGRFHEEGQELTISVGFREMLDKPLRNRLLNGFTTIVVMRIYLYEEGGKSHPVAVSARTLKAVYDLWDEHFLVRIEEPQRTKHLRVRNQKQVIDWLTSLWHFPIMELNHLKPGRPYFVAVIAEVNPMSEELLEEVRRWLRTPYNQHSQTTSGGSFFGSFVSIFVNKNVRRAEKTFRLRTQPFIRRP